MKKWMVAMTMATMMVGGFTVFAAEAETAVVSNITKEDFLSRRTQQINEALEAGEITQEQADLLLERSKERAEEGTFGYGRSVMSLFNLGTFLVRMLLTVLPFSDNIFTLVKRCINVFHKKCYTTIRWCLFCVKK